MEINDANARMYNMNHARLVLSGNSALVAGLSLVVSIVQICSAISRAVFCRGLLIMRLAGQPWKMFS